MNGRCATIATALLIACGAETASPPDAIGVLDAAVPDAPMADAHASCSDQPPCPVPAASEVSVCGTVYDAETGRPLGDLDGVRIACSDALTSGACAIGVTVIDANDPNARTSAVSDTCGGFQALVDEPILGRFSLAIDDAGLESDLYVLSSRSLRVTRGSVHSLSLHAVRSESDAQWTMGAGSPFGSDTFGDVGTLVVRFEHEGQPVENVSATVDGNAEAAFYFSGNDANAITTLDSAQVATGSNGTAFVNDWGVHGAMGGLPAGCAWPDQLNGGTAGRYRFHTVIAECK